MPQPTGHSCATSSVGRTSRTSLPRPGWLIFALPPTELGVHPTDGEPVTEIHLMCDDIEATVDQLKRSGVEITGEIEDRGYGLATSVRLPSGAEIGLYEPRHLSPLDVT
jgi:hypothetical protein